MKPDVKAKWCKALRSGEYVQSKFSLRKLTPEFAVVGYCCLGVLCDLHSKETGAEWDGNLYLGNNICLPDEVVAWAGLETADNWLSEWTNKLARFNDTDHSFTKIANIIEENL